MKLKHIATSVGLALALGGIASTVTQAASITVPVADVPFGGGIFGDFGGFDWALDGKAVVSGFALANTVGATDSFDLIYWAKAGIVTKASNGSSIVGVTGHIGFENIEYTIVAKLTETAKCTVTGAFICTTATFSLTSGTFDIYYQGGLAGVGDANQLLGTGFKNGTKIISGLFNVGPSGSFTVDETDFSASGSNPLSGVVTSTNNTYINPNLVGTTVDTTLQLGSKRTDGPVNGPFPNPSASPDGSVDCTGATAGIVCFQADANQSFSEVVPEPGSLALVGLGLLGVAGIVGRRRKFV